MNLDRFKGPTASDEMVRCVSCPNVVHYESLDDRGYCPECQRVDETIASAFDRMTKLLYERRGAGKFMEKSQPKGEL